MRAVAIHPDPQRLWELTESIMSVHPHWEVNEFSDQLLAVKFCFNNRVDALYTYARMRPLDGFCVARLLRRRYPDIIINFIAADDEYRQDAMRFGAQCYTVEPVTAESLKAAEAEEW